MEDLSRDPLASVALFSVCAFVTVPRKTRVLFTQKPMVTRLDGQLIGSEARAWVGAHDLHVVQTGFSAPPSSRLGEFLAQLPVFSRHEWPSACPRLADAATLSSAVCAAALAAALASPTLAASALAASASAHARVLLAQVPLAGSRAEHLARPAGKRACRIISIATHSLDSYPLSR